MNQVQFDSTTPSKTVVPSSDNTSDTISVSRSEYHRLLEQNFQPVNHHPNSTTTVTVSQSGNSTAFSASSSTLWIIDSCAYSHMSGKSSMFTSFVDTTDLPFVTLADGSKS